MPDVRAVEVKPITDADIQAVAEFLHLDMGSGVSVPDWHRMMTPPWDVEQPNHGYLLRENGRVIGAYLALYSERIIDGRPRRICNLGTWCVTDEHRATGLRLLRSLLRQRGYTFTDLTPNPTVVALDSRLGFAPLDTARALIPNMPWPVRSRGVRVVDTPNEIDGLLSGRDHTIYRDHAATAAHQVVLAKGDRSCLVMFRRDSGRVRRLPLFASILYVGNPDLFRDCAPHFYRYLLLRRGIPVTLAEVRVVGHRPARSVMVAGPSKMYLSEDLQPEQIDYLYSELTCFKFIGVWWEGREVIGRNIGNVRRKADPGGMRTNLHHLIEDRARSHPDSPALTFKQETLDYDALWTHVRGVAAGLGELGVAREQRVAVFLDKRIETVAAIFGASAAGAAFVPVNPLLRPAQVGHILRDCDVRVLVTSPERLARMRDELASCPTIEDVVLVGARIEEGEPPAHYRVHGWERLRGSDHAAPTPNVNDLDIAAIIYTSGSTGRPKGVVLSHRNVIAASAEPYLGNTADDVLLAALPLSFDAGFSRLTTAFAVGAHVILMNYLLPGDVPRLCAQHRVTGLLCVPPLWIQIVEQKWPEEARASLRYFANTGGRMPKPILDRLREVFPSAKPFLMYGLTEAFRSTYLDPAEVDRRPGSIGKAVPGAEILVVRPDGSSCDPGEEGELVHRGPHVALGYWNDPVRTAERFRPVPGRDEPWRTPELEVWSGDTVIADADGFLYFVGRKDEMIKTSGYRVSPTEVEEVAYATGLVRGAVALGVEDETLGQRVLLVVAPAVKEFDTDALLEEMKSRLPLYMVPSSVVVRDAIPRSPNGKFHRALLRDELAT